MDLLNFLQIQGYEIIVLSTDDDGSIGKFKEYGIKTYNLGKLVLNPIHLLRYMYRLYSLFTSIQPRAVLTFTIRPNIFASLVSRCKNIPVVSNVTGVGQLIEKNGLLQKIMRFLYSFSMRNNKMIFFQNEFDMNYFLDKKYVYKSNSRLLPGSGVDTKYFSPRPKTEAKLSFLMISRLIVDKGVFDYIEAARIVKKSYPDVEFGLLGPFWTQSFGSNTITKEEVENWVSDGIIKYYGYTEDVRSFIAESDCVVLPSYREGCANVLMQGASMGKPLIATDVIGCNMLVDDGNTGYLCDVRSPQSLAIQMIRMISLSQENREEMGSKGRLKMKSQFEKKIVLENYLEEIQSI